MDTYSLAVLRVCGMIVMACNFDKDVCHAALLYVVLVKWDISLADTCWYPRNSVDSKHLLCWEPQQAQVCIFLLKFHSLGALIWGEEEVYGRWSIISLKPFSSAFCTFLQTSCYLRKSSRMFFIWIIMSVMLNAATQIRIAIKRLTHVV
jgi:hypothetical protein